MSAGFLDENFDPSVYLKSTLKSGNFENERNRLQEATTSIDRRLHKEVADNFPKLKEQVQAVQDLDRRVEHIQASANQLKQSVQRTKFLLEEPYVQVQNKVKELQNIWGTAEILRKLGRFLSLISKVREHQATQAKAEKEGRTSAASLDLPKEAKTLRDIELALNGGALKGITVVDREVEWLRKSTDAVKHRANDLLKHGLASTNQTEIRTAIQAFYNMEEMSKVVFKIIADCSQELRKTIREQLDPQNIVSAITSSPSSEGPEQKTKTLLFQRLEAAFQAMLMHITKLSQLVKVLETTRDPVTQVAFICMVQKDGCIFTDEIWKPIATIEERMPRLVNRFSVVVTEFPKVHHLFEDFVQNASEHFPKSALHDSGFLPVNGTPAREAPAEATRWKEQCLAEAQSKYLKQSFDRLKEKTAAMLQQLRALQPKDLASGNTSVVPNATSRSAQQALQSAVLAAQVDIRPFVSAVNHELAVTQGEFRLQQLVFMNVAEVTKQFVKFCETERVAGKSAVVVSSVASSNQLFNSVIVTALLRLHDELSQCANRVIFPQEETVKGHNQLLQVLAQAEDCARVIMADLFTAVQIYLEAPLAELLSTPRSKPTAGTSKCLHTLEGKWRHLEGNLLVLYSQTQGELSFRYLLKGVVQAVISLFVRLLSLTRPLDDDTKVSLVSDVTQFQVIISNMLSSDKLGKSTKELRAFRTQLSLDTKQLHSALTVAGRHDSLAPELAALTPLTLLLCLSQRIASTKSLPDVMLKEPMQFAKAVASEAFAAEVEDAAWAMFKEWGEQTAVQQGGDDLLLWECVQAWHKRRMSLRKDS